MRAAGIKTAGGPAGSLDMPTPRGLRAGEVLVEVRAAGVGNWDDIVRTGGWDTGARPPMALGVEAAGLVADTGAGVKGIRPGDRVTTLSVPLREQGTWAELFIADAADVAAVPAEVAWDAAGALPVPGLAAAQALAALDGYDGFDGAGNGNGAGDGAEAWTGAAAGAGRTVLVNGAGGVTGGLVVQLAAHAGARVIATAAPGGADRVRGLGASDVLDYNDPDWPAAVRELTGGGADGAVNAAWSQAATALEAVRDGGALATITSDAPAEAARERGIAVTDVYVAPDGALLGELARMLAARTIEVQVAARYPLDQAATALDRARHGAGGAAIVVEVRTPQAR